MGEALGGGEIDFATGCTNTKLELSMALYSRRTFLATSAGALAGAALPRYATALAPGIHYGYAAITWGAEERQAIDDIASAGYRGIQFRANALTDFKPAELKQTLAQHK